MAKGVSASKSGDFKKWAWLAAGAAGVLIGWRMGQKR